MKKNAFQKNLVLLASLLVIFCLAAFVHAQKNKVTISGIIEANEIDENSEVLSVAIGNISEDGAYEYYYISNFGKGKELLKYVGENLKLVGTVSTDKEGQKKLAIISYVVIKDEQQEEVPVDDESPSEEY